MLKFFLQKVSCFGKRKKKKDNISPAVKEKFFKHLNDFKIDFLSLDEQKEIKKSDSTFENSFFYLKDFISPVIFRDRKIIFSLSFPKNLENLCEMIRKNIECYFQKKFPGITFYITATSESKLIAPSENKDICEKNLKQENFSPLLLAVSSGKGGVGKSTTAFNLALALSDKGLKVGLLDADIYGPSLTRLAQLKDIEIEFSTSKKMNPIEKFGIKMMSIGFFLKENNPLIWRAPMAVGALKKMLYDSNWGEIDILVADMPPGTGDIPLSMAQKFPLSYVVFISTPQELALMDVRKAISMYRKLNIPILGIIENMSYFKAPDTGKIYYIFGQGKVLQEAQKQKIDFLGSIPIDPEITEKCDVGDPVFLQKEQKECHRIYKKTADKIINLLKKLEIK